MKIAVVGSGISGLVATFRLGEHHDVTLYESDAKLGGHVNTIAVNNSTFVDTGFIVFNRSHYPTFSELIDELYVKSKSTSMSFSLKEEATGLEYSGSNLVSLFAQPKRLFDPRHWRMLKDIRRFMREGATVAELSSEVTVAKFLQSGSYSKEFGARFLIPLSSALWSTPQAKIGEYSVRFVAGFLLKHEMLTTRDRSPWQVIVGGSNEYVKKLLTRLKADVRLNCPVLEVARSGNRLLVDTPDGKELFDHVVFACHADQALSILKEPSKVEHDLLSSFEYESNEALLHTDISVLPRSKKAWACWNYFVPAHSGESERTTVTYNMNMLQGLVTPDTYLVSLNMAHRIDESKVIQRMHYSHPVGSVKAEEAKARRQELIDQKGISYCGAYWGFGFHEDGARSGGEVAKALLSKWQSKVAIRA